MKPQRLGYDFPGQDIGVGIGLRKSPQVGPVALVVSRPEDDAGMAAQAPDDNFGFTGQFPGEGIVLRVHAAGHAEILPDHQA